MEFKDIFRSCKFVSLVPKQAIITPKELAAHGEWGIKHALPRSTYPVITVDKHDDPLLKKPKVHSAWNSTTCLKAWKENFVLDEIPPARAAAKASIDAKPCLSFMDKFQWHEELAKAQEKSAEFNQQLQNKTIIAEDWDRFLNIALHAPIDVPVHPPTYLVKKKDPNAKVKGRILNSVNGGFAVGVSGIVAFLPMSDAKLALLVKTDSSKQESYSKVSKYASIDRTTVFEFYVKLARHDSLGRPEVVLTMHVPKNNDIKPKNLKLPHENIVKMLNLVKRKSRV